MFVHPLQMERRVKAAPSFPLLLFFFLLSLFPGGTVTLAQAQGHRRWCVAKPSSDDATLTANLNFACSHVDCGVLRVGGECFFPNSLISHASLAMNIYYQSMGRNYWNCYFNNSALIAETDPSELFTSSVFDSSIDFFWVA
ncbi:major pollen allergen Ole e 10 [Canna indica]|uniref:Major pollen allergen Ole e 10 n=1 Tax=Canna indica TaxID=4628 RepID=A0AAQ3JZQ9_9LILI|nr:major pollen allergen Ole e 10 [Canna indica]